MEHWLNRIDDVTRAFKEQFGNLSIDELNLKPEEGGWSIAQNMHHLIVINSSYFPILSDLREAKYKRPFFGRFSFLVNLFGKMILKSVHPSRQKKIKTFPIWEPSDTKFSDDLFIQFEAHQEELKQAITKSENLIATDTVIASPANKNIVYTLETAFEIIVTHEERHLSQAREIHEIMRRSL